MGRVYSDSFIDWRNNVKSILAESIEAKIIIDNEHANSNFLDGLSPEEYSKNLIFEYKLSESEGLDYYHNHD